MNVNENIETYMDTLYFTAATLPPTGFGDIALHGDWGHFLSVVIMVVGGGNVFAFGANNLSTRQSAPCLPQLRAHSSRPGRRALQAVQHRAEYRNGRRLSIN